MFSDKIYVPMYRQSLVLVARNKAKTLFESNTKQATVPTQNMVYRDR